MRRLSNVVLTACVSAACVIMVYDYMKPLAKRAYYDDSLPIRFLSARLEQDRLPAGAPQIKFAFSYSDKRPQCHPPQAPPGLIRFRIWFNENDWIWLRFENLSYAPASAGRHEMPLRAIPLPPLPPGKYQFQWTATYQCLGSSGPLTVESPKLKFEIN